MTDPTLILLMIALFVLIGFGIPIGYSLFAIGFAGVTLNLGFSQAVGLLRSTLLSQSQSFTFATIPMFVLMALILNNSGLLDEVFDTMDKWTRGVVPGGLAIGTTVSNGVFAALSGSSAAAAAAISKIAYPQLTEKGYHDTLAMGTVAASGTFAMMFPPSIALIIYGILTDTSIGALFIAGIVPGFMTVFVYLLVILTWAKAKPESVGTDQVSTDVFSWRERLTSLALIWPVAALVVLVLGGIYMGVMTPTEAGAVGAAGSLILAVVLYDLSLGDFNDALIDTANITAYIFIMIIGATFFGRFIALEGVINDLLDFLLALPISGIHLVLLVLAFYVIVGMFLDQLAVLVLTLPVTYPLFVTNLGYDSLWFGIIIIKTIEIGMITPPIGINAYIASNAVDIDASITFKGAVPFIIADIGVIGILLMFPEIVTFLPS